MFKGTDFTVLLRVIIFWKSQPCFFYFSIIIMISFFLLSGDTFSSVTFPSFKVASTVVSPGA